MLQRLETSSLIHSTSDDHMKNPALEVKNFPAAMKRKFRARVIELGSNMRDAIVEAMKLWLDANRNR